MKNLTKILTFLTLTVIVMSTNCGPLLENKPEDRTLAFFKAVCNGNVEEAVVMTWPIRYTRSEIEDHVRWLSEGMSQSKVTAIKVDNVRRREPSPAEMANGIEETATVGIVFAYKSWLGWTDEWIVFSMVKIEGTWFVTDW